MEKRLFRREFERRLIRLRDSIDMSLNEGKEGNLFPCLFQVWSYLYTGRLARLKSNGNYEL